MTVSAEDVRRLLAAEADAVLVLLEGRTAVVTSAEQKSAQCLGALQIITREELVARVGGAGLCERQRTELAADLDTAVSEMGG